MSFINPKIRTTLIIDALLFLIGLAGIYQLVERAGFNPTSYLNLRVSDSHKLVIEKVLSAELDDQFMAGDTLLKVDTYQVSSIDELEVVTDSRRIADKVDISISRLDKLSEIRIQLKDFYSFSYILIAFLVGAIFFFHGLFVIIKRPDDQAARIYHWVSIGAAMIIMTTWGRYTIDPQGLGYLVRICFSAAYAFTPVLFFHFSFLFPRQKWSGWKSLVIPAYLVSVLLFLWTSLAFLFTVVPEITERFMEMYLLGFNSTRWFFIVFLISGLINFIHSFYTARETAEKKKVLWLLLGMIGPLGFVILWQIPQALNYSAFLPEEIIILFASVMPLTFTISIIRYHIMDIYLIINRSTVYTIAVAFLLTLYALIIAIAMIAIDTFTTESSIITSAVAAILLALLFEPVRQQVQKLVDKKFFKVRYDYRIAQRKFLEEMKMGVDLKNLAVFTLNKLDELLQPNCISLLMIGERGGKLTPYTKKHCTMMDEKYIEDLFKITTNSSAQLFSFPDQIEPGVSFHQIQSLNDHPLSLAIPVRQQNGNILGLLCMGKKRSENVYSLEDIDLLKTVITQLGLAIERLRLQRRLLLKQEEAKKLEELNELQSFFISSVSHDLQTPLTAINMYLDLLEEKKNLTDEKKLEYFHIIRGESERLSKLINNVLDISKIERGVKQYNLSEISLNDLLKQVYMSMKYQLDQHKFAVELQMPASEIIIRGDLDSLDRAFTNLISNSIKYSSTQKNLLLKLYATENDAIIEIADKGVGIDPDDQKRIFNIFYRSGEKHIQSVSGAGLGLAIVDHVINAHRGKIELKSSLGQGSTFTIRLPMIKKELTTE